MLSTLTAFQCLQAYHKSLFNLRVSLHFYSRTFVRTARISVRRLRTSVRRLRISVRTARTEIYSGCEQVYCLSQTVLFYEYMKFILFSAIHNLMIDIRQWLDLVFRAFTKIGITDVFTRNGNGISLNQSQRPKAPPPHTAQIPKVILNKVYSKNIP